jgi:hypothetical protein
VCFEIDTGRCPHLPQDVKALEAFVTVWEPTFYPTTILSVFTGQYGPYFSWLRARSTNISKHRISCFAALVFGYLRRNASPFSSNDEHQRAGAINEPSLRCGRSQHVRITWMSGAPKPSRIDVQPMHMGVNNMQFMYHFMSMHRPVPLFLLRTLVFGS